MSVRYECASWHQPAIASVCECAPYCESPVSRNCSQRLVSSVMWHALTCCYWQVCTTCRCTKPTLLAFQSCCHSVETAILLSLSLSCVLQLCFLPSTWQSQIVVLMSGNYTRRALCSDLVQEVALTHSSGQGHNKARHDDCTSFRCPAYLVKSIVARDGLFR